MRLGMESMSFNEGSLDHGLAIAVLAGVLILALTYGLRSVKHGKARYERVEKQGSSSLLSKGVMNMAYWGLEPLGNFCARWGVSPNLISYTSLIFGFLAGIALCFGHFGTAGSLGAVSSLLDSVDGMVARKLGVSSDAGEVLDASVDRYVEFFFVGGLVIYYREVLLLMLIALAALLACFMVSYSTAKAESLQVIPPRGNMRRTERAFYLTLGAVLAPISIRYLEGPLSVADGGSFNVGYPMVVSLVMVAILGNISALQRLIAIAKALRLREKKIG
jgi:phosphatidylglycerophosphate synthase